MSKISKRPSPTARKKSVSKMTVYEENVAPWPEWSDDFVNSIIWDPHAVYVPPPQIKSNAKGTAKETAKGTKKGTAKDTAKGTNKGTAKGTAKGTNKNPAKGEPATAKTALNTKSMLSFKSEIEREESSYEDGFVRANKIGNFEVDKWEKYIKINGMQPLLIGEYDELPLDLVAPNEYVLKDELLKEIIEGISCLYVASLDRPFTSEFPDVNFVPVAQPWKPWHHVYAMSMVGDGGPHSPAYNKYGRYAVRLYFFGKWRRIDVDDTIPIDSNGNILLPRTTKNDLWLLILSKALLRVVTALKNKNISVITALTGWIKSTADLKGADSNEIWNVCCSHLLKENDNPSNDMLCSCINGSCINDSKNLTESKTQTVYVFGHITELIYNYEEIDPNRIHLFTYLSRVKQDFIRPEDYPKWKVHRWFDWAYRHNILNGKLGQIFKNVFVYSPFWEPNKTLEKSDIDYFKNYEFDKFRDFIDLLELYYKPSQFESRFRTINLKTLESIDPKEGPKDDERAKTAKPGSKKPQTAKKQTADETVTSRFDDSSSASFFLVTDSPYCKRIYIDFMFCNESKGHIICEKFYWYSDTQATPIFFVKPEGFSTKVISAGPGRHTFRFWCELPKQYYVQIYSNTPFLVVQSVETVQDIYQDESVSYKIFGNQISQSFQELLTTNHASEQHGVALKNFLNSFYPSNYRIDSNESLAFRVKFDTLLEECIIEFLMKRIDLSKSLNNFNLVVDKIRKLFLNPSFGHKFLKMNNINIETDIDKKADEVESIGTRKGKKTAKPLTTAKNTPLPKANDFFFDKQENSLVILKAIMKKENSFLQFYPFCNDDKTKIILHEYKGKCEISISHPFFIAARLKLNIHDEGEVPCGIYSIVQHDYCRTCVYDIATMEMKVVNFDRNSIWSLKRSDMGYMILLICFNLGPPRKNNELQWRIRVYGSEETNLLHPCLQEDGFICNNFRPSSVPTLFSDTITGYYIPNSSNLIGRFLIIFNQNDVVTIQISVTNPSAVFQTQIKNIYGIVRLLEGKGNILLPSILLDLEEAYKEEEYFYEGEIILMYNTWEISEDEATFINSVKEDYIIFTDVTNNLINNKRKSKSSFDEVIPLWTVTVTSDYSSKDKIIKLKSDTRTYDSYMESVTRSDDRARLCDELREKFKYSLEDYGELYGEADEMVILGENDETGIKLTECQIYKNMLTQYTC